MTPDEAKVPTFLASGLQKISKTRQKQKQRWVSGLQTVFWKGVRTLFRQSSRSVGNTRVTGEMPLPLPPTPRISWARYILGEHPHFLKTTQGGKAPACTVINSKKLHLGTAFLLPPALGHGGSRLPPLVISAHPLLCIWSFCLPDPLLYGEPWQGVSSHSAVNIWLCL